MVQFEIEEASRNLAELVARAALGEEIVLVQAGKPIVRLVPIAEIEQEVLKEEQESDNSLMEEMLLAFEEENNWQSLCSILVVGAGGKSSSYG